MGIVTTIQMLKARIENIEKYLIKTFPPSVMVDFIDQSYKIQRDFETVGPVPEKQEINYKANYERLAEVEKAHREQIARLTKEVNELQEEVMNLRKVKEQFRTENKALRKQLGWV